MMTAPGGKYRRDVDGLRAIAILSVILFHIDRAWLPGGFLGVDVFFVLSGYLITGIIWNEALAGDFSIVRFYERRVRRIMPALLFVLIVTSGFALALLLPGDLENYAKSLVATLTFVANIYFYLDTNYFSTLAEYKPLLHMWSLGVEEQFYIFFPLLILLAVRFFRSWTAAVLMGIVLLSLALNVGANMVGGQSPAFFLLPTRVWELGAGSFLAVWPRQPGRFASLAAFTGALLLIGGLIVPVYKLHALIPAAVPVVFGTALLVWSGQGGQRHGLTPLLGSAPMVRVGLISYSLYLWHWPVLVFSRYYLVRELTVPEVIVALLLMFVLASLSLRFVEAPFRSRYTPFRKLGWPALALVIALCAFAAVVLRADGFPQRLDAQVAQMNRAVGTNFRCPVSQMIVFGPSRACRLNLPSGRPEDAQVILLGNSHMQMYAPVWRNLLERHNTTGVLLPANGCLPTPGANIDPACFPIAAANLQSVLSVPAKIVVIGFRWPAPGDTLYDAQGRPAPDRDLSVTITAVDDLVARLRAGGKRVILLGPIAEPGWDVASEGSRLLAFGWKGGKPFWRDAVAFRAAYAPLLTHYAADPSVIFVRPDQVQCGPRHCDFVRGGLSLFADSNHVSQQALPLFAQQFEAALQRGGH